MAYRPKNSAEYPILKDIFEPINKVTQLKLDDIYSLNLLQSLLVGFPFLPFTGSSIRPFCLLHLINDIIINNRKNIIEFGSGISTVMVGRLIKTNRLNATVLSVENDLDWVKELRRILEKENLSGIVTIIHAPLTACKLGLDNNQWYDLNVLNKKVNDQFDMVVIDGPQAWEVGKERARFPALPFMSKRMLDSFSIYLDDANRVGERSVLDIWKEMYEIEFRFAGGTLAYHHAGRSFYTEPFVYY